MSAMAELAAAPVVPTLSYPDADALADVMALISAGCTLDDIEPSTRELAGRALTALCDAMAETMADLKAGWAASGAALIESQSGDLS